MQYHNGMDSVGAREPATTVIAGRNAFELEQSLTLVQS